MGTLHKIMPFRDWVVLDIRIKVRVKFTLAQATKAQRRSRGIPLLFL
jgi:hypothetical protein